MPSPQEGDAEDAAAKEILQLQQRLDYLRRIYKDQPQSSDIPKNCLHNLLLLSDSALPLGSFAFSSGLESFLVHVHKSSPAQNIALFTDFLKLSLESLTGVTLPYVHEAWVHPSTLEDLDSDLDASTTCTVAKRASVAQGRALLTMWQRSLKLHLSSPTLQQTQAHAALARFSDLVIAVNVNDSTQSQHDLWGNSPSAHFAPLFGALAAMMGLPVQQTLYLYLLNHAKTLLSAAIRASILGPYQSQSVLASASLKSQIERLVSDQITHQRAPQDAGQHVPAMDIWSGRHELVYSRIFNS